MKKTILFLLFAALAIVGFAQDYNKVMLNFSTKKYEDAKNEIDKLSNDAKAKDKPETYLWRTAVYGQLYSDSVLTAKYPDAAQQAVDAFTIYQQKDPSLKLLKEGNTSAAINSINAFYRASLNQGFDEFTAKSYQNSFNDLRRATALGDFIIKNGYTNNKEALDTITILYTGHAAQNMGKPDSAMVYYKQLADRKVSGKGYDELYRLLLVDLSTAKQTEDFNKYLVQAKELYPDQASLWSQLEMNNMSQNSSADEIMTKYNQEAGGNLTEEQLTNYAETFANPQTLQKLDSTKQLEYNLTTIKIYERTFGLNPNQGLYAYNAGLLNYNIYNKLEDQRFDLRGESAALKAQRAAIVKQQQTYVDSSIVWLEKGYEVLKAKTDRNKSEANALNRSVDMLANLYMWKREQTKGTAQAKDYDKYDAKFQQYDAEHDKYKM